MSSRRSTPSPRSAGRGGKRKLENLGISCHPERERDGMRRPTSWRSRKIALQDMLEGTRKEIGHGEVYQGDEGNRIGSGGRVERLGGSGRVGHGGAARAREDDGERVAECVRSD